jgi:hypothetical protein
MNASDFLTTFNGWTSAVTGAASNIIGARTQLQMLKNAQAAGQPQPMMLINQPAATPAISSTNSKTMLYIGGGLVLVLGAILVFKK